MDQSPSEVVIARVFGFSNRPQEPAPTSALADSQALDVGEPLQPKTRPCFASNWSPSTNDDAFGRERVVVERCELIRGGGLLVDDRVLLSTIIICNRCNDFPLGDCRHCRRGA